MRKSEITYLLLGSNMDDRLAHLKNAQSEIAKRIGTIQGTSSYYESQAWGDTLQENYWNICLEVSTELTAEDVLATALSIEDALGRVRTTQWAARTIDIDVLFYGENVIKTKDLEVPHPRIQERNFVLIPMMELNGDFVHPVLQLPIDELFFECNDPLEVYLLEL
jgi:2-amino-4-hydroxy-6-hydroxymethyldihydropteridine diphosphokinase